MANAISLSNREKAAVLLICLGPEYSAELYKHMTEDEISDMTYSIAMMHRIDRETRESVIEEFYDLCMKQQFIMDGGLEYARDILYRVIGTEQAETLIGQLLSTSLKVKPFELLRKAEPMQVLNLIHNEHPQIIALILSHMQPNQSAEVISALESEMQADIIMRIAKMGTVSPDYVREAEQVLERKVLSMGFNDQTAVGGLLTVVDVINALDRNSAKNILEILDVTDAELSEEIKKNLLVFEDILKFDNRTVQLILNEVQMSDLAVALKASTDEVVQKVVSNMSKRGSAMLIDDMEVLPPLRIRDVEEAQQRIVGVIRKLEDEGQIIIPHGEGDDMYV